MTSWPNTTRMRSWSTRCTTALGIALAGVVEREGVNEFRGPGPGFAGWECSGGPNGCTRGTGRDRDCAVVRMSERRGA